MNRLASKQEINPGWKSYDGSASVSSLDENEPEHLSINDMLLPNGNDAKPF